MRRIPSWALGLAIVSGCALAFWIALTKNVPFSGDGYTVRAEVEDASTLVSGAPVRIAGVDVGEVKEVERTDDSTVVTFTVDERGRPVNADATLEIRPRTFLEGNLFVDLHPGNPSAPELASGGQLPVTQTATSVQLDEVLGTLQLPTRRSLQAALDGFGTALSDDPRGRGTAAEALNRALRDGGPAGRDTAIASRALLGERPHDVSRLIGGLRATFGKLDGTEHRIEALIGDLNITAGALAASSGRLSASVRELAPTLDRAGPALRAVSDALPPVRTLARELAPSLRELPATRAAAAPWLGQARPLLGRSELGGLARSAKRGAPGLAATAGAATGALRGTELISLCLSHNLIPTADVVVDDGGGAYPFGEGAAGYPSGVTVYQDLLSSFVGQAGMGQSFDGNGSYLRANLGGGGVAESTRYPPGGPRNDVLHGNLPAPTLGTRPSYTATVPPYATDVQCHGSDPPDVNGAGGSGLPGDVGPPSPEPLP